MINIFSYLQYYSELDWNDWKKNRAMQEERTLQQYAFVHKKIGLQNHLSRCYDRMKNKAHSNLKKKKNIWIGRTKNHNGRSQIR